MKKRVIETEIDIKAPIERVWRVLTDFPSYSQWSRFIAGVEGSTAPGAKLSVLLDDGGGVMRIGPEVLVCAPHELRWRGVLGASFLFSGEHYFRLDPVPGGATRLTHGERFCGLLLPMLWRRLDTRTRQGFQMFNEALRRRSEDSLTR